MMMRIRIIAGLAGLGLAIIAVARNDRRIAWAAIVVLAVALVLRLIARRRA
jgi:hypothetical protein